MDNNFMQKSKQIRVNGCSLENLEKNDNENEGYELFKINDALRLKSNLKSQACRYR